MEKKSFLSIGECMVEFSPVGKETYKKAFAGDTFNTVWYIRRLLPADWAVSYLTSLGADGISDEMIAFMQKAGIGTGHVTRLQGKTVGLYMIHLDQGERRFSYWRTQSAARELAGDPIRLRQAIQDADVVYFSGITMGILPEKGQQNLLEALSLAGNRVVFDPNLRPALWKDAETMRRVIRNAADVADIVLPSFEDEARFFGDGDPQQTLDRYHADQPRLVVVKNGSGAIHARDENNRNYKFLPAPVVTPRDTTAAGDSFNAGFLAALMTGCGTAEALGQGARLAAKVIGEKGALVSL